MIIIRTFAQAVTVNATLPCGAGVLSADQRGRYIMRCFDSPRGVDLVEALCGGVGATGQNPGSLSTRMEIEVR